MTSARASAEAVPEAVEFRSQATRFDRIMRDTILPFWSVEGVDRRLGLYWERFDFAGQPVRRVPYRFMVQARQMATFAQAASHAESAEGERALLILDRALSLYSDEGDLSRGLAFSLGEDGAVMDSTRDAYSLAFALFALAAAIRLSGESRYRVAVDDLLGFIDRRLCDPSAGGLLQRWPHPEAGKAQNPTMHLLEAYLALHEAWPERGFLDRARSIVDLVEGRLVARPAGIILEHYTADWAPRLDEQKGRFFEPGHQFEWAWLLGRYARLSSTAPRSVISGLWSAALHHGLDAYGFCFDEVGIDHVPVRRSRRLWPHCEGARAALTLAATTRSQALCAGMLQKLNDTFLARPFAAGWIDRFDETGAPAVDFVPASSLYHLYGVAAELRALRPANSPAKLPRTD